MYLRNFSLQVGTNGSGLELSPNPATMPKATFHTYQHTLETPNHVQVRVYNLSNETVQQIQQEFVQMTLSAGYIDSNFGQIFNGSIVQVKVGYEGMGGVDSFIEIYAGEGDLQYAHSIVSTSIAKGSTFQTRYNAVVGAINNYGNTGNTAQGNAPQVSRGYTDMSGAPQGSAPRGRVFYGNVRDHLRDLAIQAKAQYYIQDNQVILLGNNKSLPTTATTLTPQTGLIGWPEQTEQGIKIRSLLNPNLKPGGLVEIQGSAVNQATLNTTFSGSAQNAFLPSIGANGSYKILLVEHFGDTRGNDWYTDLTCIVPNEGIPQALIAAGYYTDGNQ